VTNSRNVNWEKWRHIPEVRLWEAIALSLNIDPDKVNHNRHSWMADDMLFDESSTFNDRLEVLKRNPDAIKRTSLNLGNPSDLPPITIPMCKLEFVFN
jgi:hypothetical protein